MAISDDQINRWAKAPSDTEDEKCRNAFDQINAVLSNHFGSDIKLIRQGSHKNKTNIKLDSDIDIAVVHTGHFFPDTTSLSPSDKELYERNRTPSSYPFLTFKTDIFNLLRNEFGTDVQRKNKCIRIKGNSYRVNADVVPAYEHHRFQAFSRVSAYGIELRTDKNEAVVSFPEQHYKNGVKKNSDTNTSYKSIVRILKNLRNKLLEDGEINENLMSSYFIECLVWNAPNADFTGKTWREDIISVSAKVWNNMRDFSIANNYAEVSNLHLLFKGQKRTPKQAEDFMLKAWQKITQ